MPKLDILTSDAIFLKNIVYTYSNIKLTLNIFTKTAI